MLTLILATEEAAAAAPPGDEFAGISLVFLGIVMVVAAIATLIVTPGSEEDH